MNLNCRRWQPSWWAVDNFHPFCMTYILKQYYQKAANIFADVNIFRRGIFNAAVRNVNTDWKLLYSTIRHTKLEGFDTHDRISVGYLSICGGTQWRSRLRHCATSRKVAGSIPDSIIGIFYWLPSGGTMALGSIKHLNRNEYHEYLPGDKANRWIGLKTLPLSCADCLEIFDPQACAGR